MSGIVEVSKMTEESELLSCLLSAWTLAKLRSVSECQLLNCKNRNNSTWPTFYLHVDDNIKCNGNSLCSGGIREPSAMKESTPYKYKLCSPPQNLPNVPRVFKPLEDKQLSGMVSVDPSLLCKESHDSSHRTKMTSPTSFLISSQKSFMFRSCLERSGCYNKLPLTGWLNQQTFISHSSRGWDVQYQGARRFSVQGELASGS